MRRSGVRTTVTGLTFRAPATRALRLMEFTPGALRGRIRAVNALDIASLWATSAETELTGKVGKPPMPVNLATQPLVFGIGISGDFRPGRRTRRRQKFTTAPRRTVILRYCWQMYLSLIDLPANGIAGWKIVLVPGKAR